MEKGKLHRATCQISFFVQTKKNNSDHDHSNEKKSLIENNLNLVGFEARKYANKRNELEDLVSVGSIGLIKAAENFDPQRHVLFATYASKCIRNEILMYLRKNRYQEIFLDDWSGRFSEEGRDLVWDELEHKFDYEILKKAAEELSAKQKTIVQERFGMGNHQGKSQKEVALALGISQSCVSKTERRFLALLKKLAEKERQ